MQYPLCFVHGRGKRTKEIENKNKMTKKLAKFQTSSLYKLCSHGVFLHLNNLHSTLQASSDTAQTSSLPLPEAPTDAFSSIS